MLRKLNVTLLAVAALAAMMLAILTNGCKSVSSSSAAPAAGQADEAMAVAAGAQLWVENCGRCHSLRDPASFSAAQWEVSVHHMRVRVPLTAEQQKAITEFLSSR